MRTFGKLLTSQRRKVSGSRPFLTRSKAVRTLLRVARNDMVLNLFPKRPLRVVHLKLRVPI